MDGHFSGHRGPNDEWVWDELAPEPETNSSGRARLPSVRWPRWRALPRLRIPRIGRWPAGPSGEASAYPDTRAIIIATIVIAGLVIPTALLALAFRGTGGFSAQIAFRQRTMTAAVVKTVTATPATVPGEPLALGFWDKALRQWTFGNIGEQAAYQEGDRMPFLVRWTGARRDATYEVTLHYDCRTSDGAAIDFISGLPTGDDGPAAAQFGPGPSRPDAAIPLPDDTSLTFDDATSAVLQVWGGTFAQLARGPLPDGACAGQKSVVVQVTATSNTVYLLGSAHLAAAADWSGRGASALNTGFSLAVNVSGVGVVNLSVLAHAVSP